jgi:hypothetical protein
MTTCYKCFNEGVFKQEEFEKMRALKAYDEDYYGIAEHVFKHRYVDTFVFQGQTVNYAQYYERNFGKAYLDLYFFVIFFLLRSQQVRNESYINMREKFRTMLEHDMSLYETAITANDFNLVLRDANAQVTIVTDNEGARMKRKESRRSERRDDKDSADLSKSSVETVSQMIEENEQFDRFKLYAENIEIVTRYLNNVYKKCRDHRLTRTCGKQNWIKNRRQSDYLS